MHMQPIAAAASPPHTHCTLAPLLPPTAVGENMSALRGLGVPLCFLAAAVLFLALVLAKGGAEVLMKSARKGKGPGLEEAPAAPNVADLRTFSTLSKLFLELRRPDRCHAVAPAEVQRCASLHSCLMAKFDGFQSDSFQQGIKTLELAYEIPQPSLWDLALNMNWIVSGTPIRGRHVSVCCDTLSPSQLKHLPKGSGGTAEDSMGIETLSTT